MMVRNEENFVKASIESILPIAKQVIVFDTGSTDRTVEIVKGINSKKIKLFEKGAQNPIGLVKLRNEMVKTTKTEWFMVVDGDEIFYIKKPTGLLGGLGGLPANISRVEVTVRDFVNDPQLVARDRVSGKIWKTKNIEFIGTYPFEGPALKENRKAPWKTYSTNSLKDLAICFHMVFFPRSPRDVDVEIGRHWRGYPFPVLPYFGNYPAQIGFRKNILVSLVKFFAYNFKGLFDLFFHKKEEKKDARSPQVK